MFKLTIQSGSDAYMSSFGSCVAAMNTGYVAFALLLGDAAAHVAQVDGRTQKKD